MAPHGPLHRPGAQPLHALRRRGGRLSPLGEASSAARAGKAAWIRPCPPRGLASAAQKWPASVRLALVSVRDGLNSLSLQWQAGGREAPLGGEQRGARRQSGVDPSLSPTRTCLGHSEVACKRAAGAGEREGWAKLRFVPFCPFSADFSSAVWRRTDHAAHGCVHTGGQHHLTAAICVAAPPEPRKPGAATALRRCGVAAAASEARCVKSPSTAPARCHRAQGWR